jgi:hypothetical protein
MKRDMEDWPTDPNLPRPAVDRYLHEKVDRHDRLHEQVLQELYGLHDQPGIRAEIKLLRADHEDQRMETRRAISDVENKMENIKVAVERIGDKQIPRWLTAVFLGVFAVCAVAIAGLTLVNTLRSGL